MVDNGSWRRRLRREYGVPGWVLWLLAAVVVIVLIVLAFTHRKDIAAALHLGRPPAAAQAPQPAASLPPEPQKLLTANDGPAFHAVPPPPKAGTRASAPKPAPRSPAPTVPRRPASPRTGTPVVAQPRVPSGPCTPGTALVWRHSGGDPYAQNEKEAYSDAKLDTMLACNGIPREDWAAIKQYVRNADNGAKVVLKEGGHFATMMSGNGHMFRNGTVAIPGGQRALEFDVEVNGHRYILVLPFGCWNWIVLETPLIQPPDSDCITLSFNAEEGGHVRWGIGSAEGPVPPDWCNAQREGEGPWHAWWGECDWCKPALAYIQRILGPSARVYHRYYYPVKERHQTLRFSRDIYRQVVYICLEHANNGGRSCGVYMRPEDWKGRTHVEIPDSLWREDNGDCPH
ncbi:MAG: hypothetical protein ACM3TU_00340 [Bacillota bacterium]